MAQASANHIDKEHFLVLWESLQVMLDTRKTVNDWDSFCLVSDGDMSPCTGQCDGGLGCNGGGRRRGG